MPGLVRVEKAEAAEAIDVLEGARNELGELLRGDPGHSVTLVRRGPTAGP